MNKAQKEWIKKYQDMVAELFGEQFRDVIPDFVKAGLMEELEHWAFGYFPEEVYQDGKKPLNWDPDIDRIVDGRSTNLQYNWRGFLKLHNYCKTILDLGKPITWGELKEIVDRVATDETPIGFILIEYDNEFLRKFHKPTITRGGYLNIGHPWLG